PLIVPWITLNFGWRWTFIVTGLIGTIWILAWLALYKRAQEHPKVSSQELALIESDPPDPKVKISWGRLAGYKATWAYIVGTLLTPPFWCFYLFGAPDFFEKRFPLDLKNIGPPLIAVYLLADIGSVGGGWLSSSLIKKGWTIGKARKTALLI